MPDWKNRPEFSGRFSIVLEVERGLGFYSELTKTSTALPRLAILSVLSVARRLVLIFVNSL